jgi:transposase
LPPYCPHLNSIERLWAVMHQQVTHNRYYPTQKQFANAILRFFCEATPSEWTAFQDQVLDNLRVITHENIRVLG